ncbi:hypothetical protein NP118_23450, partial [Salmonella enterica]|nr:hypothetical protein [Salmonella enterica]
MEEKGEQEKTKRDIEEIREKVDAIIAALEKGKMIADTTAPDTPIGNPQAGLPFPPSFASHVRTTTEASMP